MVIHLARAVWPEDGERHATAGSLPINEHFRARQRLHPHHGLRHRQFRPDLGIGRDLRTQREGCQARRAPGQAERFQTHRRFHVGIIHGQQRTHRGVVVLAQVSARSIEEDDRAAAFADEIRQPPLLLGLEQVFRHLAKDDQLVGVEHGFVRRKVALLVAAHKARLPAHAGDGGVDLPFFVALIQVLQITRFPTRASVHEQHLALLGHRAEAEAGLVVGKFPLPLDRGHADFQIHRHTQSFNVLRHGLDALGSQLFHWKVERDGAAGLALGNELLFPNNLLAVLHLEGEGLVDGDFLLDDYFAADNILEIDAVGHNRLKDGKVAGRNMTADAKGEHGHFLARQNFRHLDG